jgi:ATP-dependent Clp protease ATP-binding subunit ClpC
LKPERFTEQAQELLGASQEVVRRYHHKQWDVEHVLLALLEQEEGTPRDILQALGADIDAVKNRVGATLQGFPKATHEAGQIHATPRIAALLENANREADRLKDEFVSTEHFLIAIAAETGGEAAAILTGPGITQEKIYQALQEVRGAHRATDRQAQSSQRIFDRYGYDLTQMTIQGKLTPVTGKDHEINQLIEALAKKTKSPLLVADVSIDKFSIVQGLAQRIASGDVPPFLHGKKIVALDLGKLVAGAKFRGEFEERVGAVLDAVRKSEGMIIPYFDELWVGAAEGGLDIGSLLKLPLAVGEFQCIAATVPQYLDYFRARGLLAREFEVISVVATEGPC